MTCCRRTALHSPHFTPETEMWRGARTGKWWHAFRIETIYQHPRVSEDVSVTREQDARRDFNPS